MVGVELVRLLSCYSRAAKHQNHSVFEESMTLCTSVLDRPGMHPTFANVVGPAISRRRELWHVDRYLGMLNDSEKDRQCSRHLEIEYGCHLTEVEIL